MANTTTYDVNDVNFLYGGVVITGFSKDSIIKSTKNEDNFTPNIGAKGDVCFAESADGTGTIEITLKQTSPSCAYLDGEANKKGDAALKPAQVVDLSTGGISSGGTKARVMKPADKEYGPEESDRTYSIYVADYTCK
ncbi:MAG: DUF3277 family protein [Eubacteriaceae bacterium]|nr:DUF3277 family protein [Eubacteriaceae bacterium]